MSEPILNQAWEDVADDVTSAIEKAMQPLLKKAVDDLYGGLLDATQDYLKDNLAFNIASRISASEREASHARYEANRYREALQAIIDQDGHEINPSNYHHDDVTALNQSWIECFQIAEEALNPTPPANPGPSTSIEEMGGD